MGIEMANDNSYDPIMRAQSTNLRPQMSMFVGYQGQEEEEQREEPDPLEKVIEDLEGRSNYDNLAGLIAKEFYIFKGAKLIQEQIALRAHQNCKGVYPADMQFEGTSRAFVQATRPKVQTAVGVIMPIILPPGSNSWTISPDGDMIDKAIVKQMLEGGADVDQVAAALKQKADDRCDAMTSHIVDALSDTEYPTKLVDFVWDVAMYGTGFMRGPLAVPTGYTFDPALADTIQCDEWRADIEPISFWEAYPDPGAKRREDMISFIRRRVTNKSQMRKFLKDASFNKDAVEDIISSWPNGNWTPEWWESIINITNSQPQLSAPNGRYIVLEKWGFISGRELYDAGFTDIEEDMWDEQVLANIWTCGHRVIKLKVSELYKDIIPIYIVPWSKNPSSLYGMGLPEMMFDTQDAINASERAIMDNFAMSSGPIGEVNEDRLSPGQDVLTVQPRMILRTKESELSNNAAPAVRWTLIPNNVPLLQAKQDKSMMLADEQTSFPKFLGGSGGDGVHNRTLGGASLQFNNAMNPTKAIVFNFENGLIIPMIEDMVKFYQEFSKDPRIAGTFKVDTKSVQGIMAREVIMQQLGAFLQIMSQNQQMAEHLDYDRIGDVITRYMGLVDAQLLLPDSVVDQKRQQAQQQQAMLQMQGAEHAAKIKAETSPKDALLTMIQQAPENSATKIALLAQGITAFGFMDQATEEALTQDESQYHIQTQRSESEALAQIEPNSAPAGVMPVAPKMAAPGGANGSK